MKNIVKFVTVLSLITTSLSFTVPIFAQEDDKNQKLEVQASNDDVLNMLFSNSYAVFSDLRNDKGVYRDSILLEPGENYHPSSVAATGIGLMSLTIADKKKWESDALAKAKQTVLTMIDQTAEFHADRTSNGFYRHFINMETGAQEWNSEYSTVDTAIFLAGALFAEKYFNDSELSESVAKLYQSIDFEAAIADTDTGGIYLTLNEDGTGVSNSITLPYNEYIIVAWLAYNQNSNNPESKAVKLWQNHYETPETLLTKSFDSLSLLTDHPDHYLSSFTLLFPYYMVNMFSKSNEYNVYIENSYKADKLWSAGTTKTNPYEWGNGAGAAPAEYGYHADSINNNKFIVISPHIISGFLPVNPSGAQDLLDLYRNKKGVYPLQSDSTKEILWRYSIEEPEWKANSIQGIDYSTFLFGLATLDNDLGLTFFQNNNNFFTKITFDLNGGTGTIPPAQHLAVGDSLQEPTSKPTRSGYTFIGWSISADGTEPVRDFAADPVPDSDMTLYAQWAVNTPIVTFDLNGGTGAVPPEQNITVGAKIQEPTAEPTRTGYTFTGWSSKVDGSEGIWDFAANRMPNRDVTLYAQWQLNTYIVTFDVNGGTSETPPVQTAVFGSKVQEPTRKPTRNDYNFSGWYDENNNSWDFGKMTMPDNNITLVAHWEKVNAAENASSSKGGNTIATKPTMLPSTGETFSFLSIVGLFMISGYAIVLSKK